MSRDAEPTKPDYFREEPSPSEALAWLRSDASDPWAMTPPMMTQTWDEDGEVVHWPYAALILSNTALTNIAVRSGSTPDTERAVGAEMLVNLINYTEHVLDAMRQIRDRQFPDLAVTPPSDLAGLADPPVTSD